MMNRLYLRILIQSILMVGFSFHCLSQERRLAVSDIRNEFVNDSTIFLLDSSEQILSIDFCAKFVKEEDLTFIIVNEIPDLYIPIDGFFIKGDGNYLFFQGADRGARNFDYVDRILLIDSTSNQIKTILHINSSRVIGVSKCSYIDEENVIESFSLIYSENDSLKLQGINLYSLLSGDFQSDLLIKQKLDGIQNEFERKIKLDKLQLLEW